MNKEVETQNAPLQETEASQVQVSCFCDGRPPIRECENNRPVLKCGDMFALLTPSGNFRSGLTDEEGVVRLTRRGLLLSNEVFARFLEVEKRELQMQ